MEQRRKISSFIFTLVGGFVAVFMWVIGGSNAILYLVLGVLIATVGLAMWRRLNRLASYALLTAGFVALGLAVGRALIYDPMDDLVIVLSILGVGLLFRGFQWLRAVRRPRTTSENT